MGKVLVIAEKPSAGADMAKVLGCTERKDGYIEGGNHIVTWAVGHLIGLKEPQEHDEKYASWNLDDLPLAFDLSESLKVLPDTAKQFKIIKDLIARPDVDSLINAGDAGREGYLIQSWIYRMAGNRKPVKVLWASSLTEEALKKAFANLKNDNEFRSLLQEAEARAEGDFMLGMNYSRLLTLTRAGTGTSLPYGRCQTPLLNLVVTRDIEIENFKSTPYYNLETVYGKGFKGSLVEQNEKGTYERKDITDKASAEALMNSLQGKRATVKNYKKDSKSRKAPLLYNLAELQKSMGSKYGYTPEETLKLAQTLYEKYKILSYPRTDSQHLSMDLYNEILEHLQACEFGPFKAFIEKIDKSSIKADKRFFNDHKVTDHHALIPTIHPDMGGVYKQLTEKEKNVFDAIVSSFISIFYPDYEYDVAEVIIEIDGQFFLSKGTTVKKLGFKEVLKIEPGETDEEEKEEKQLLPEFAEGDELKVDKINLLNKMTQAPKRYTVSSLISVMEKYNIGTSATRAEIIKKLQNPKRTFMVLEKGKYKSTKLGRDYIRVVPEELKRPELTAQFEEELNLINQGKLGKRDFLEKWEKKIMEDKDILNIDVPEDKVSFTAESMGKCPICKNGDVVKNTKGFGCSAYKDGCKFQIWGTNVKEADVKMLLSEGKTKLIKGFVSQAGKSYNAFLQLNEDGTVGKIFENSAENAKGICPKCKSGKMIPSMKAVSCEDREGCGFIIWKTMCGKNLTDTHITQLIEKGKTSVIKGFTAKSGSKFDAALFIKDDFTIGMEFENKK